MSFSTPALMLAQMLTSSSLKPQYWSYSSSLVKYYFLLSFFSSVLFLYLSGTNGMAGYTLSGFGTAKLCCCRFSTLSSLIPLQWLDFCACFISIVTSFFSIMTSYPSTCWFLLGYWYNYIISGTSPCHLLDELLTAVLQHQRLLAAFIDNKQSASCHWLLMTYACSPFSSSIKILSKYHSWWVKFLFNTSKQGLKHPLLVFL